MDAQPLEGARRVGAAFGPGRIHDRAVPGTTAMEVALEPVGAPLPDVPGHIIEAVPVGRERADRGGPHMAVGGGVGVGKLTLPDIGAVPVAGRRLVAPGIGP